MFQFYGTSFVTTVHELHHVSLDWVAAQVDDAEYAQRLFTAAENLRKTAEQCKLPAIADRMESLKKWAQSGAEGKVLVAFAASSFGDIQRELLRHIYFRIPHEERPFFENLQISERAGNAFPSSVRDIRAAGRGFALDEHTASVLHLMRALEFPLQAMADALGVTITNPNWHLVLRDCETAIQNLGTGNPPTPPDWKDKKEFYSEAAINFRYFKDAWRNHTSHARLSFDKREAYEVLTHVAGFMDHLSQRIQEKS